ncbi:hypothetical protein D1BOALGB6SA_10774 [Olavius sp. associated proteobacterium Delta 1]|nr:hypothetical protein D1BOALGB6SA_10774 [Olavius sp. associated proteobacterium Delta 1]
MLDSLYFFCHIRQNIELGKLKNYDSTFKPHPYPLPSSPRAIEGRVYFMLDMNLIIPKSTT